MTHLDAFLPLFSNPHLATIAGNFWPRTLDTRSYPVQARFFHTEPCVQILVHSQVPVKTPKANLLVVHGLEGSSDAGYARSLSQAALERGYAAHRFNMRSCGGTEAVCGKTLCSLEDPDLERHARPGFDRIRLNGGICGD